MRPSGSGKPMTMKQLSEVLASRGIKHNLVSALSHPDAIWGFVESIAELDWKPLTAFVEECSITEDKINIIVNIKGKYNFIIDIFYDAEVHKNQTLVACSGRGTTKCDGHYIDNISWDLKHLLKNQSDLKEALSSFLLEAFSNIRDRYLKRCL